MTRFSLPLLTLTLLFSLSGCFMTFTHTLASSQRVTVGEFVVVEQIYREEAFPDPRYTRVYQLEVGQQSIRLGDYADEGREGMTNPPSIVGDWLVVMSGAHLFFWQRQAEVRHFYPYDAVNWVAYAEAQQLNGHYDYAATAVAIEGDNWHFTYACTFCLPNQPKQIHFRSVDGGQSYRVQ